MELILMELLEAFFRFIGFMANYFPLSYGGPEKGNDTLIGFT
jgi:hypothetical protein